MAHYELAAFVHPITDSAQGFIFTTMKTGTTINFIRISSADSMGMVSLFEFDSKEAMLESAKNMSRFNPTLICNDDMIMVQMFNSDTNQKMLDKAVMMAAPHLFDMTEEMTLAQANA